MSRTDGRWRSAETTASGADATGDLQHVVAQVPSSVALVPAGGVFEGQVAVQGETRIDGVVRGTLRGTGCLEVGSEGQIEGLVECDEVRSQGAIRGPVVAPGRVALGPGAMLNGDLETPRLELADTATWNGKARVGST